MVKKNKIIITTAQSICLKACVTAYNERLELILKNPNSSVALYAFFYLTLNHFSI